MESIKPKVSIVTITNNRASLLKQTITSVLSQTYKDFEYIIIDDGSEDNTEEVVSKFNNTKIRYFKQQKSDAISTLRNSSISKAKGKYIALIDSDDLWLPTKLQSHIDILESNDNVGYVFCNAEILLNESIRRLDFFIKTTKRVIIKNFFREVISYKKPIHPGSNIIAKRECFDATGFIDENLKFGIFDFVIRLSQKYTGAFINEELIKIRRHDSNLTLGFDMQFEHIEEYIYTLNKLLHKKQVPMSLFNSGMSKAIHKKAHCFKTKGDYTAARKLYIQSIKINPLSIRSIKIILKLIFRK